MIKTYNIIASFSDGLLLRGAVIALNEKSEKVNAILHLRRRIKLIITKEQVTCSFFYTYFSRLLIFDKRSIVVSAKRSKDAATQQLITHNL